MFALQEHIAKEVITALQETLTEGEQARLWASTTSNGQAWIYFQRGHHRERLFTREGTSEAKRLYERALKLDGNYLAAIVALGFCHMDELRLGWAAAPQETFREVNELYDRAVSLNPNYPDVHGLAAFIALYNKEFDLAIGRMQEAIRLAPNSAEMVAYMGMLYVYLARWEDAILHYERAMSLSPHYSVWIASNLAWAHRRAGRLNEALVIFEEVLAHVPDFFRALIGVTSVYGRLGRIDEARAAATKVLRADPLFSVENWSRGQPAADQRVLEDLKIDLHNAGLP
jgi:tetratricopeptide (TPR) repeat protein